MLISNEEREAVKSLYGIIKDIAPGQIIGDDSDDYLHLWLKVWIEANKAYTVEFPLDVIKQRIDKILERNIITPEEREDIYQTLAKLIARDSN